MNAVLQPDLAPRVSELGTRAWRTCAGMQARLEWLARTPVTYEVLLMGQTKHGLDLPALDALLAEMAAFIAEHGDQWFTLDGAPATLAHALNGLSEMQSAVAKYRENGRRK